jgi:hypothetical protein
MGVDVVSPDARIVWGATMMMQRSPALARARLGDE